MPADVLKEMRDDELRDLFTEDAHIDYGVYGGSVGDLETTIAFLKEAVATSTFPNCQHLNANVQVALDGDDASGRVMCFNPMEMAMPDGSTHTFMLGLWYAGLKRRAGHSIRPIS